MSSSSRPSMDSLGLTHTDPRLFATAQWARVPPLLYVCYRVIVALFFVTWILLSGTVKYNWFEHDHDRKKWFIYLTNWSFTLLTLCTIVQAACAIYHYWSERTRVPNREYLKEKAAMPLLYKAAWVLYNVSSVAALLVTILFWVFIYPSYTNCQNQEVLNTCGSECTRTCMEPEPQCVDEELCVKRCQCPRHVPIWYNGTCVTLDECPMLMQTNSNTTHMAYNKTKVWEQHVISKMTHAGNSIYVLLNIWITATPMNILHFWHFAIYAAAYISFTVLYYCLGGTNAYHKPYVYNVLNWQTPEWTIGLCAGCFILGFLLWLVLFAFTMARVRLHRRFCVTANKGWSRTHGQSRVAMIPERESESSFTSEMNTPPFEKYDEYGDLDDPPLTRVTFS